MSGIPASQPPEPVLYPGAGEAPLQAGVHALAALALVALDPQAGWLGLLLALVSLNLVVQLRRVRRLRRLRLYHQRAGWWLQDSGGAARPVSCRYRFLSPLLVVLELEEGGRSRQLALLPPAAAGTGDWRHLHRLGRAAWRDLGQE